MLGFEDAKSRDVLSLQYWDLLSIAPSSGDTVTQLRPGVEDKLIRFYKGFHEDDISRDLLVYINSGSLTRRATRTLIVSLMLIAVVICRAVDGATARMTVIIIFTILFIATLSSLTKAKIVELVIAGAIHVTVLIVFVVSGTNYV